MHRLLTCLVVMLAAFAAAPGAALAANDFGWGTPTTTQAVTQATQTVKLIKTEPTIYYAFGGGFTDENSGDGWYMGVQVDGVYQNTTANDAIFSVWNASSATPAAGAYCATFGGEGVGYTCRAKLPVVAGDTYHYVMQNAGAHTWRASVENVTTGTTYGLGTIVAPAADATLEMGGNGAVYNFIENWSGPSGSACATQGSPAAQFSDPLLSAANGYSVYGVYEGNHTTNGCEASSTAVLFNSGPGGVGEALTPGPAPPAPTGAGPAAPSVTIATPANGATYAPGQVPNSSFTCAEGAHGWGIVSCKDASGLGPGEPVPQTLGTHLYTVTAVSADGLTSARSVTYTVAAPPPSPAPSPVPAPTPRHLLKVGVGGRLIVSKRGYVSVAVRCANGSTCTRKQRIQLDSRRSHGIVYATVSTKAPHGRWRHVKMRLSRRALHKLEHTRHHRLRAWLEYPDGTVRVMLVMR